MMCYLIIGVVCLTLIVSALVYGKALIDKRCLLTEAVVVFSDENGSIVKFLRDEYLFYRVKKSLDNGSVVLVLDPHLVENVCWKENWYVFFRCRALKRLLREKYYLKEAVFSYNDKGKRAIIRKGISKNRWFAVDVKTKEPILLHCVPEDIVKETNPLVNYENLVLTSPIGVTEAN